MTLSAIPRLCRRHGLCWAWTTLTAQPAAMVPLRPVARMQRPWQPGQQLSASRLVTRRRPARLKTRRATAMLQRRTARRLPQLLACRVSYSRPPTRHRLPISRLPLRMTAALMMKTQGQGQRRTQRPRGPTVRRETAARAKRGSQSAGTHGRAAAARKTRSRWASQ